MLHRVVLILQELRHSMKIPAKTYSNKNAATVQRAKTLHQLKTHV